MPILYVNPSGGGRKTFRVSGKARFRPPGMTGSRNRGRMRKAGGFQTKRGMGVGRSNPSSAAIGRKARKWTGGRKGRVAVNRQGVRDLNDWAVYHRKGKFAPVSGVQRNPARRRKRRPSTGKAAIRRKKKRTTTMAKRRKRKAGAAKRRRRGPRTAARLGHRRRRRRAKAAKSHRRRRRRARKNPAAKRRRRRKSASAAPKRRRRRKSSKVRSRRRRRKAARKGARRRRRHGTGMHYRGRRKAGPRFRRSKAGRGGTRYGHAGMTLKGNPSRRRRRRSRRRGRRAVHRRRRYRRNGMRRNPGKFLIDLAKRAIPVVLGFYGARFITRKIAPMIPGISSLGALAGPVVSIGVAIGANVATNKVGFLAKRKNEIMLGVGVNVIDSIFSAFAPASVKELVGMSEYVGVGGDDIYGRGLNEYVGVGADPLDDDIALNGYIQVSGAEEGLGVDEELGGFGVDEELGLDEGLGGLVGGGMPGGLSTTALQRQIPQQSFSRQIPARSFTRQIPQATGQFDNPAGLYVGIFNGGFGT